MKLNANTLCHPRSLNHISRRNAYHQAGQAVAVHLGNQQQGLPALHFQILVRPLLHQITTPGRSARFPAKHAAKLEGGRLIPYLPNSFQVATQQLSIAERKQCQVAFAADVINILAGPLAEAKHVALRDDEVFNANLVYLGALKFYGGGKDLKTIDEYMACLYPDNKAEQGRKLSKLFLAAYGFINDKANWQAITRLAETLYNHPKEAYSCDELIALIDSPVAMGKPQPSMLWRTNPLGWQRIESSNINS